MTTPRTAALHAALVSEGFPPARASQLVARLARVAKRRRPRKRLAPIDHQRASVVALRQRMTHALSVTFAARAPSIIASAVKLKDAGEKLASVSLVKMSDDEAKALGQKIAAELDLGDWSDVVPDLQALLLAVGEDGITAALGQVGVSETDEITEQVNEAALAYAKERAADMVGMRLDEDGNLVENPNAEWAISDATRELLRGDITSALEDGLSDSAFADQLSQSYAFSADRAATIAHTEMARAEIEGNLSGWRASGVVEGKEWFLSDDHSDEDECNEAADMGVVPLDDDFGGVGDPPAHPNCACALSPVVYADDDA